MDETSTKKKSVLFLSTVVISVALISSIIYAIGPGEKNIWIPEELTTNLKVKAAYNQEDVFFFFQWESDQGIYHDYLKYEGGKWVRYGASTVGPQPQGIYEDRLTFLLDDGSVPNFATLGGFLTAHEGFRFLSSEASADEVKAHPYLGKIKKKKDVRKYIPETRSEAGWQNTRSVEELQRLREAGVFLDLWHWRAHRSNPIGYADDQWVMDYRNSDSGKGPYTTNWDKEKNQPKFMFDSKKTGFYALQWDDIINRKLTQNDIYYLSTEIAAPYDPNHGWKEGDVIPRRLLRTPTESHGDIKAKGVWSDGTWKLELQRKLDTGNYLDDKALTPGRIYNIAFAVHKGATGSRWHYVSLPYTLGIGEKADITAVAFTGSTPNWDAISFKEITLFYPGQATYEFLTSDKHPGKDAVLAGEPSPHTPEDIAEFAAGYERLPQVVPAWILSVIAGVVAFVGITAIAVISAKKGGE